MQGLSIYARSATHHPLLSRLVLPTVERVARQALESTLEQQLRDGLAALERALIRIRQELAIAQARGRTLTWGDWVSAGLGRLGRPTRKARHDPEEERDDEEGAGGRRSIEARRAGIIARPADGSTELAIGFDAQLLPGKATPHSRRKEAVREDARTKADAAEDALRRTAETGTAVVGAAGRAIQEGQRVRSELVQDSGGVVTRWADDHWETDAFDLR